MSSVPLKKAILGKKRIFFALKPGFGLAILMQNHYLLSFALLMEPGGTLSCFAAKRRFAE
ncbi:hypothetical protein ES703_64460 [subsurface metagenome]